MKKMKLGEDDVFVGIISECSMCFTPSPCEWDKTHHAKSERIHSFEIGCYNFSANKRTISRIRKIVDYLEKELNKLE